MSAAEKNKGNDVPHTVKKEDRVPLKQKITYAMGQVGVGIQEYADNGIIGPIFVIGAGINPALMGVLGMFYRLYDAFTDATMGWVTDNTRTRWGRRRPYLFSASFLMAAVMPMMFMFNPDWELNHIIIWMVVFQLLLTTTQTMYNIPYQCLMLEMTPDTNERTNIGSWRSTIGNLVSIIAGWTWALTLLPIFQPEGIAEPDPLNGAPWVLAGLGIFALLLGIQPAIFNKERTYEAQKRHASVSIVNSMKRTLRNKPFLILLAFILTGILGGSLTGSMGFFVKLYYVCDGSQVLAAKLAGIEGSTRVFLSIGGIWFFRWFSQKTSKINALMWASLLSFLSGLSTFWLYTPENPYLSLIPTYIMAPAITAKWLLVLSMIGDVVDDEELKTGDRLEGSFSAVFSWVQKVTWSLISAISGFLVVLAGFDVNNREALTPEATMNMRLFVALLPSALVIVSMAALYFYPLKSKRIWETRETLEARRGKL